MSRSYLICYDIRCQKRLRRVHKTTLGYAVPVQKSIFYAVLEPKQHQQLIQKLSKIIDSDTDDIKIYPVPETDLGEWPKTAMTGDKKFIFM